MGGLKNSVRTGMMLWPRKKKRTTKTKTKTTTTKTKTTTTTTTTNMKKNKTRATKKKTRTNRIEMKMKMKIAPVEVPGMAYKTAYASAIVAAMVAAMVVHMVHTMAELGHTTAICSQFQQQVFLQKLLLFHKKAPVHRQMNDPQPTSPYQVCIWQVSSV